MTTTIWHNPRCSKSRQTLELLKQNGIEPTVFEYLKTPPSSAELATVLGQLGMQPRELLRRGESAYKDLGLDNPAVDGEDLLEILTENPKLIERPIVVKGNKARIGRPPENVLEIL